MDDQQLITRTKRFSGRIAFGAKDTNTLFKVAAFRPEDEDGATIPGVTIEIVLRTGVAADRCKYTFTLFHLSNQKQRRVYQLEVVLGTSARTTGRQDYMARTSTTATMAMYDLYRMNSAVQTTSSGWSYSVVAFV